MAALGGMVQLYLSNARLAMAMLQKQDSCECNIAWGKPEMDGLR